MSADLRSSLLRLLGVSDPSGQRSQTADAVVTLGDTPSLDPNHVRDLDTQGPAPKLKSDVEPEQVHEATPPTAQEYDTKSKKVIASSSLYLSAFGRVRLYRSPRPRLSHYIVSYRMMSFVMHLMCCEMLHNFQLKRSVPLYHPILFKIYMFTVAYYQNLRVMAYNNMLSERQELLYDRLVKNCPPEKLWIPGPMMNFIKAISSFKPELASLGHVYPVIPDQLGNADGTSTNLVSAGQIGAFIPQIPLLFAYLRWLSRNAAAGGVDLPAAGTGNTCFGLSPFSGIALNNAGTYAAQVTFAGYTFPADSTTWDARNAWALSSPGLEYPVEQDRDMLVRLRENIDQLAPPFKATNASTTYNDSFFHLNSTAFLLRLSSMMQVVCDFWPGSGTLKDCAVHGMAAGYVLSTTQNDGTGFRQPFAFPLPATHYNTAAHPDVHPRHEHNDAWLRVKHSSTSLGLPPLTEILATATLTNVQVMNHPHFNNAGHVGNTTGHHRYGTFWAIRPVHANSDEDEQYLGVQPVISSSMHRGNVAGKSLVTAFDNDAAGTSMI